MFQKVLLAASLILAASASAQSALTLDQCVAIALSENPVVQVADMEIRRTDYSRGETLSQLLPQVNFGANYSRMLAKQVMYMSMDGFGGGAPGQGGDAEGDDAATQSRKGGGNETGIKMGLDNSYQIGFSAAVPLIAPQLWKSLKLSNTQILQSVEQARASRLDLVNQVKDAYYALMLATDSRAVVQESYDMAAFTHELYKKQFEAGAASDYDVLRTSVAMKNIEPELLQADIAIKQARLQLLVLMGVDADFPLQIADKLSDYQDSMFEESMTIDGDYSLNSSLVQNSLQTRMLRDALGVQKMAWLPTLSASINYYWNSNSNGSPFKNFRWSNSSSFGLSLSLPIFTGGARYSRQRQAQVQLTEAELQRENIERSVAMQVDLAIDNIRQNVRQIASNTESVAQAERAHDIMERSFAIGAASYLDLRDSELALTRSRLARYQSIYNYLVARSQLELLRGTAPLSAYQNLVK
ncbi:MAG: TolC family protein [Muribaculaceae bacterium]|nr:TolC family protein [Muribaculaceae bacterium]